MESRDFIEFVKVKLRQLVCLHSVKMIVTLLQVKDHMLAVQFSIATKKFESFRKPFVTNKYLSLIQWEEIMFTINRVLSKQLKLSEDEQLKTKGEFTIDESLQVTYRAKPRDECYIDFNKLDFRYNLHWIFSVAVSRPEKKPSKEPPAQAEKSPKSTRSSQKSSNSVVSIASTISVPSEQEYDPSPETKELMSRYTPGKSEGPNRQALGSPEYCPQSTDKSQPSSSTYTASRIARNGVDFEQAIGISKIQKQLFGSSDEDNSPMVLLSPESGKTSVVRVKKRGLLATVPEVPDTNTPTQKKIARWLNTSTYFKDPPVPKISSRSSRTKSKDQEAGTSSKNPRTTKENTNPIDDLFDEEKMKQMKDFVASSLSRQEQRKARKKELEDYEMKDCTDLSNAELKR